MSKIIKEANPLRGEIRGTDNNQQQEANPLPHFFARYNLAIEDAEKLAAGTHVVDRIVGRDLKIKRLDIKQVLKSCDDLHKGKTVKI
jgi:hypothetical protein